MDLKLLLIFALLIFFVNSKLTFKKWQEKYNIVYPSNDIYSYNERKQAFDVSVSFVTVNQLRFDFGSEIGLNGFADVPFQQFSKSYNGLLLPPPSELGDKVVYPSNPLLGFTKVSAVSALPDSVDYRNYSMPVQNQKLCNACWAFAVVASLETKLKMKSPNFKTLLSPQFLVDCDTRNYGCIGGWPTSSFNYIVQNSGNSVPSLANYPYFGYQMRCRSVAKFPVAIKAVVQNYTNGNENMMKEIVALNGPIVVAFHATSYFQLYSGGIFYDPTCNSRCTVVNHAIVIMGYGTDSVTKKDYWIIKNSWSTSWGQNGYGYIERNRGNQCSIACWAMYTL